MRRKGFIFLLFLSAFCKIAFSQVYPVQLSAQLIPPYSGYLPDYADPSSEKLKIIIQFNDFNIPQYNLRLKIEIKGNGFTLITKQLFNPPPLTVQPGVPLLLSGADLAPYLNSNNLDFIGINQSTYEQRMALPEGYYSICVKAYDYYNAGNIQVSNESCTQAWFTLSDPPFLNQPACGTNITPQVPQNILFQWTPMNMSSPNSALNTEYEFALWEVRPDSTANPNQVVLSTAPIFSTTTNLTLLNYGITEPALNLYMKYVWRVRAIDITGRDWFKNSGYSQICTFVYGNAVTVLGNSINLNLTAQGITHRLGKCTWNTQSIYTKYLLQVRKEGTQNWFDYNCTTGSEKVTNLEPNTTYEARVRGEGIITGDWSNTATFNTYSEPTYGCGDANINPDALAPQPLPPAKAIAGLIIQTGQFEVVTTQINPSGPPGWFSGSGYAKIFGLLPLQVSFKNIYIDDNNRHQQGVIQALTQGIENWVHQWDIKNAEENGTYINGAVDSVYVNGNQICVKIQGNAGDSCFAMPQNQDVVVVRDENGNQWTITIKPPPPTVSGPTNYLQYSTDGLDSSDSTIVVFEESPNKKFGFDTKKYTAWTMHYELIKLNNGEKYFVPYASVGENQTEEVYAALTIKDFVAAKLSFKTEANLQLTSSSVSNSLYKVTVPHQAKNVYAWYDGKKIGKLNVISLKAIAKKLVIVPVNNSITNNQPFSNQPLNNIFKQANVSFNVSVKPSFNFNLGNDGLEAADATLMTKYSTEMRALRDAYRKFDSLYDKEAYYVFVVNNFTDANIKGYMVRGRALGFVASTSSATEMTRVIAHELAHGAFGLEHTFPAIAKSSSDNLMDYKTGTELGKVQWEQIKSLKFKISLFDEEEDGALFITQRQDLLNMLLDLKKGYKENASVDIGKYTSVMSIGTTYLSGIDYDYITTIIMPYVQTLGVVSPNSGNITTSSFNSAYPNQGTNKPCIDIGGKIKIFVRADRIEPLKVFLKTQVQLKNMLLFVNGYRDLSSFDGSEISGFLEVKESNHTVNQADLFNYWAGIDEKFILRIGTRNVVYADGHHSVSTSNHGSVPKFLLGMVKSDDAREFCTLAPTHEGCAISKNDSPSDVQYMHIVKNTGGFNTRKTNGEQAGDDLVRKINNGTFDFNKATDTLDIVAHSMGYAYSIGMITKIKAAGIKLGRYYIIAPENADGGPAPTLSSFQEVWQYGSDLGQPNNDPMYLQDGVAPQAQVPGITSLGAKKGGRVFIPKDWPKKGFVASHSISNYSWILDKQLGQDGYVKKRN